MILSRARIMIYPRFLSYGIFICEKFTNYYGYGLSYVVFELFRTGVLDWLLLQLFQPREDSNVMYMVYTYHCIYEPLYILCAGKFLVSLLKQ